MSKWADKKKPSTAAIPEDWLKANSLQIKPEETQKPLSVDPALAGKWPERLDSKAPPSVVLTKAKEYLDRGWSTGCFAKDSKGNSTDPCGSDAICWCAVGAIDRAIGDLGGLSQEGLINTLAVLLDVEPKEFQSNDDRPPSLSMAESMVLSKNDKGISDQAEAISWFSQAIARAKEQERLRELSGKSS